MGAQRNAWSRAAAVLLAERSESPIATSFHARDAVAVGEGGALPRRAICLCAATADPDWRPPMSVWGQRRGTKPELLTQSARRIGRGEHIRTLPAGAVRSLYI